jgi:DNA polymerase III delta subunit
LGREVDLFHSGDCSRVELKVQSEVMYTSMLLGVAELRWDDLLFLTQTQPLFDKSRCMSISSDSGSGKSQEIWLPVLQQRTGRQVGTLLVEVEVLPA